MEFTSSTVSIGASTRKADYDNLLENTQYNKGRLDTVYSGTNTFAGAKTFSDAVVLSSTITIAETATLSVHPELPGIDSNTSTSGVSIQVGYDISGTVSLRRLYTKIIEIGDWNMDTTPYKYVLHGIVDNMKIRKITVMIRNDDNNALYELDSYKTNENDSTVHGGINAISSDGLNIYLTRRLGGFFDSLVFDSTSYNRGWITIQYEE